jgi:hypothetical protein
MHVATPLTISRKLDHRLCCDLLTGQQRRTLDSNQRSAHPASLWTCGQRKGVAHMPKATTAAENRNSKLVQKGVKITHSIA